MDKHSMDIVYTWVNGNDAVWKNKKQRAQQALLRQDSARQELEPYALVSGRYRDNQELRYSLRALETHFPEHGRVFLVTDGQCPDWLDTNRVTLVDHTDIMSEPLPTFSSKRIAGNLFKIPTLGEDWLYLNDDVFLGPKFNPALFVSSQQIGVCFSDTDRVGDFGEVIGAANAQKHLQGLFSERQMAHAPRGINRHSYALFMRDFSDLHQTCQAEVFRHRQYPSFLELYAKWSLAHNFGFLSSAKIGYLETHQLQTDFDLFAWSSEMSTFCVNDTCDDNDHDVALSELRAALDRLHPSPSRFERTG